MHEVVAVRLGFFWQRRNTIALVVLCLGELFMELFEVVKAALHLVDTVWLVQVFESGAGFYAEQSVGFGPRLFHCFESGHYHVDKCL